MDSISDLILGPAFLFVFFFAISVLLLVVYLRNADKASDDYWKNIIQIVVGCFVAMSIVFSARQVQLQLGQYNERKQVESRQSNNKQFYESAERLSKSDLSSTEAALVAFRDLIEQDKNYARSVELVLRATIVDISEKDGSNDGVVLSTRVRRTIEEYLRLFDGACRQSARRADLSALQLRKFNGRAVIADEANFVNSLLADADFRTAQLNCAEFTGANLRNADFKEAQLKQAIFRRANLDGAKFAQANLSGADLSGASLLGATLGGANMLCANLRGAKLLTAEVDVATLAETDFDAATQMPALITREQIRAEREERAGEGRPIACHR